IEAVLGHEAIFYTAIFNLPFNLFSFTLGIYLLSKGSTSRGFSNIIIFILIIISGISIYIDAVDAATIPESLTKRVIIQPTID
ncbi:hypothetical protein ACTPEF_27305, partial [Clostridioides difficile]